MSDGFLAAGGTAIWLGILTSISPCPLATNIAAVSFVSRHAASPWATLVSGVLYALGRVLVYVGLATALVMSLFSTPALSRFLQRELNYFIGPVLILVGMMLLGLLKLPTFGWRPTEGLSSRLSSKGPLWALPLGVLFALSFCPTSAALFFGSLIPLSVKVNSAIVLPLLYGLGTAVPVIVFALLVMAGAQTLQRSFEKVTKVEPVLRTITGLVFIGAGLYLSLVYSFGLL